MEIETLTYLFTEAGKILLEEAKDADDTFLRASTMLRKRYPVDAVNAALELIDLRKRAAKKFRLSDRMFFTKEALEQSSGEVMSNYHAERFPVGSRVYDLGCGIGGDTIAIAQRCIVEAVDFDPVRAAMAEKNAEVYEILPNVAVKCADITKMDLSADYAFIDPSRRINGRRVRSLNYISPSIDFIKSLRDNIPSFGVKLSPASDDAELESLDAGIEFVSEAGECKEAVAWFGEFNEGTTSAVILPSRSRIVKKVNISINVSQLGEYVYEPDPAVIRSHTVDDLAELINAWHIDYAQPFLSSDSYVDTPFANCYRVFDYFPFNVKRINKYLRYNDIGSVIIKKRGVPFEPEDIAKKLKAKGNKEITLLITKIDNKNMVIVCNPCLME